MPNIRRPIGRPIRRAGDIPSQQRIGRAGLARDPAALQLGEVGFEEANLVLAKQRWYIDAVVHDAEVVPHFAAVDRCRCLWDQFCASHCLAVPVGCSTFVSEV